MSLQCLRRLAIPVFLTAFPVAPLAADGVDLPKAVTPRLAVVSKIKEADGTITCSWVVERPVFETRTREVNGKTEAYVTHRSVPSPQSKTFSLANAVFQNATGNRVSRETFESRVKLGDTILVSADGKPVDQAYLRILRDDVLILVPAAQEVRERYRSPPQPPAMPPYVPRPAPPPSSTPPLPAP
jgi:hypothetical protein